MRVKRWHTHRRTAKQGRVHAGSGACCFNRMLRGGNTGQVTFGERPEGREEVSHKDTQRERIPGTANSQCKGSEAQHLEAETVRGQVIEKWAAGQILLGHMGHCE